MIKHIPSQLFPSDPNRYPSLQTHLYRFPYIVPANVHPCWHDLQLSTISLSSPYGLVLATGPVSGAPMTEKEIEKN